MGLISLLQKLDSKITKSSSNDYSVQIKSGIGTEKISYTAYSRICAKYFSGMEEIESMWSVITNLGLYTTNESNVLIEKCNNNIHDLKNMVDYGQKIDPNFTFPLNVPAYIRLAMLYEKREDYESGIAVCIEAIKMGAVNDNSKGRMYGRLARLIKKSGIEPTQEMINMINIKE